MHYGDRFVYPYGLHFNAQEKQCEWTEIAICKQEALPVIASGTYNTQYFGWTVVQILFDHTLTLRSN